MARGKQNYHIIVHGDTNQAISDFYAGIIKQVIVSNNLNSQDINTYINKYKKVFNS